MIGIRIEAGLCNRIFQMVFAYAFSKKYQIPFYFEHWKNPSHHTTQVYEWLVQRFVDTTLYYKDTIPVRYSCDWNEPGDSFIDHLDVALMVPRTLTENVFIQGFFQNEGYFKDIREDILTLLSEPDFVTQTILQKYNQQLSHIEQGYFLHVRLGDYLYLEKHFVNLSKYYETCIQKIAETDPNAMIVIFSNQPTQISSVFPQIYTLLHQYGLNYIVINEPDEVIGFYLMKRCSKGGICSNSTYGWWASWLNTNNDKLVFMPSRWINMDVNGTIYPDYATIIDV